MIYTDLYIKNNKFQKHELWIRENLLYETIVGSHAYGVNNKESDYDFFGLVMPKHEHLYPQEYGYILGFDNYPKFKHKTNTDSKNKIINKGKEIEGVWYSLPKYFYLAGVKGSPNLIETIFTRDHCVTYKSKISSMIRDNRRLFLSMRVFHSFKGYAFQQISRMKRGIKKYRKTGKCDNSKRKLYYEKYGYDLKMAYHPLRLINQIEQILRTSDIDLMQNKEECKAMRDGEWGSFEALELYVLDKLKDLEKLSLNTDLPNRSQIEPLHNLLNKCIEEYYGSHQKLDHEFISTKEICKMFDEIKNKIDIIKN